MNHFAKLVVSLLSLLAFSTVAQSKESASINSRSMQCFALYHLMINEKGQDEFQNKVLRDQSIFMATINIIQNANADPDYQQDKFNQIWDFTTEALIQRAGNDPAGIADLLVQCEGWREDLVRYYMTESAKPVNEGRDADVILNVPGPKPRYPITGATMDQVVSAVNSAFEQHLNQSN